MIFRTSVKLYIVKNKMNNKICRLCCESTGISYIYDSCFIENKIDMCSKIKYCCRSLDVQENDGLPSHICSVCKEQLEASYQFVLKCEDSDRKLRSLLTQHAECEIFAEPKTEVKAEVTIYSEDSTYEDNLPLFSLQNIKLETHDTFKPNVKIKCKKRNYSKRVKKELTCSVCGRHCLNATSLDVHMRSHSDERPFHCSSCDKKYKDGGALKRHIDRNHTEDRERRFMCENCGKGFYTKRDVTIHMRVHTGETPYMCPQCPQRFTQLSAMLRHKKRHSGHKTHACSICTKSFWTKEELKKHDSVHDNVRHYSCNICNAQFKHKGNIKKHMIIHSEPNRFVCNHCGQTFNGKGNLKIHIDRKHSDKSGYCNTCHKEVSNMEVHMWRHTGHRPLKCEFCSRSFFELKALALHVNFKHKKTDRYKCSMEGCSLSFPSKPMMVFHVAKYHEMQTPYSCEKCGRGFYRKNDLSRHMIGTHKERLI